LDEHAFVIEFGNPGIAHAIGHKNIACSVPCHIGWPVENITLSALPRKASATARPAATAALAARGRSRHWNSLRFSAQQHLDMARPIDLHNVDGHLIDNPDVVRRINADLLGKHEAVGRLSNLPNKFPSAIELE